MSIFDKAKQKAEELVEMVKDKLDGDEKGPETTDAADTSHPAPSPDDVTPADVAESVSDPDLPHPEPPAQH